MHAGGEGRGLEGACSANRGSPQPCPSHPALPPPLTPSPFTPSHSPGLLSRRRVPLSPSRPASASRLWGSLRQRYAPQLGAACAEDTGGGHSSHPHEYEHTLPSHTHTPYAPQLGAACEEATGGGHAATGGARPTAAHACARAQTCLHSLCSSLLLFTAPIRVAVHTALTLFTSFPPPCIPSSPSW